MKTGAFSVIVGAVVFLFLVFSFPCGSARADLLACNLFVDGFFELDIRSERTREDGSKLEVYRETKVGKDSLLVEIDSRDGNSVVFIIKPDEDSMVVFSVKNVDKALQYFYTGMVSRQGELFAVAW